MKKKPFGQDSDNELNETIKKLSRKKDAPKFVFVIIFVLYIVTSIALRKVAGDASMIRVLDGRVPIQSFAGVFSSISNVCLILLAVLFGRVGFIVSIACLLIQFPMLAAGLILGRNYTTIPGAFSNLLAIVAVIVVYINHSRVHKYQRKILEQATTDPLTGLPNRFACAELVDEYVAMNVGFALVSIDISNFKSINESMGHETGDKALVQIAARWKALADSRSTGTLDFVARVGGDEYAIITRGFASDEDIEKTISAYEAELEKKITIDNCDYFLAARFGYARYPRDAWSSAELFSCADAAAHAVRTRAGGNCFLKFTPELLQIKKTLLVERKIRAALEKDLVFCYFQPQYDINKKLRGFEALARMRDADGSIISPADFIPVAEKVGLIDQVDARALKKSAAFMKSLLEGGENDLTISFNISARHLMKNNFIDEVKGILEQSGVPSKHFEMEITESVMIDSAEKALDRINQIKAMGMQVAIDDFGTGYSSLSYLQRLPADLLKIDKSFIDVMNTSDASRKYVATIISIGHVLNLKVISEGVEEPDQLSALKEIGCDYIQGYIWGRPMTQEEARKLVLD